MPTPEKAPLAAGLTVNPAVASGHRGQPPKPVTRLRREDQGKLTDALLTRTASRSSGATSVEYSGTASRAGTIASTGLSQTIPAKEVQLTGNRKRGPGSRTEQAKTSRHVLKAAPGIAALARRITPGAKRSINAPSYRRTPAFPKATIPTATSDLIAAGLAVASSFIDKQPPERRLRAALGAVVQYEGPRQQPPSRLTRWLHPEILEAASPASWI